MASLAVEAAPAGVALHEVKALLRIGDGTEDALIAGFVRSAEALCEAFTGLVLIERDMRERVAARGAWARLSATPVRAIAGVHVATADGSGQALAPDAYAVDIDASGDGWVRVAASAGVRLAEARLTVGMAADWNGVPEPLRQGIVRLAAHLYLARGDFGADAGAGAPPAAVAALWRPWRRVRVG